MILWGVLPETVFFGPGFLGSSFFFVFLSRSAKILSGMINRITRVYIFINREAMKTVQLQFASSKKKFVPSPINWFDKGMYTHVDILLGDGNLLGSRFVGGVQVRHPGYKKFSKTEIVEFQVSDDQFKAFLNTAIGEIGKPYDWRAIASFFVNRVWIDEGSWFCSELVAWCLFHAGILKKLPVGVSKVSPEGLYLLVSQL